MAISASFAEKLSQGSGGSYFSLKNDKDFAIVRLMYNSIDEISKDFYGVHYTDDGKFECKRVEATDPITMCPLCQKGNPPKAVVFLKLYNEDTKQAQVWEKSFSWYKNTLLGQLDELVKENPNSKICQFPLKIIRNGASGDMKTVYNLFWKQPDNIELSSLGEPAKTPIKDLDANEPVGNTNTTAPASDDDLFRGM